MEKQAAMKRKLSPVTEEDGKIQKIAIPMQAKEVSEKGAASDDVEIIDTTTESKEEPAQSAEVGLYQVANLGDRQLTALNDGFLTDVTIIVGEEEIKCHSNIVSFASPKLAALLQENEPRLPDIELSHFNLLLQVIYTGKTTEPQNVHTLLQVGHVAQDLQVHAAVTFCASSLAKKVNAENLWMILDFAHLVGDAKLEEACLETIRYIAGAILLTEGFLKCNRSTLELILSQEKLCDVTEIRLFEACVAWAYANSQADQVESRRAALGSALRWIRFRTFTAEEFAKNVCPTGLLSAEDERDILRSYATGENFMPEGFSKLTSSRNPIGRLFNVELCSLRHDYTKTTKNTSTSLVFSVNKSMFLLGFKLKAWRSDNIVGSFYEENMLVSLQQNVDGGFVVLEESNFHGQLKITSTFNFKFQRPHQLLRNTAYSLNVIYADREAKNVGYRLYEPETLTFNAGLQLRILHEFLAPPDLQLLAAYKGSVAASCASPTYKPGYRIVDF